VATVLIHIFWKYLRKVVLMICRSSLNMGHLPLKTRSQEEKHLFNTSDCNFDLNILDIWQEGCFHDYKVKFEYGSSPVKSYVTEAKNRKISLTL
jgi:hypothetical protein